MQLRICQSILYVLLLAQFNLSGQTLIENAQALGLNFTAGNDFTGNGISFVDFDKDGWDDLTFGTEEGQQIQFYRNNEGSGFTKMNYNVFDESSVKQILWADIDNDNDLDLFFSTFGQQDRMFANDGTMNFKEVTMSCGLPIINNVSSGASFVDINNDGFLDLYILGYCSNSCGNHLYINNGAGIFTEQTAAYGLEGNNGPALAVSFFDQDFDGDLDVYISVDKVWENLMYENDGAGNFTDISVSSGTNISIDAMNVGLCDINNDHYIDFYVTDGLAPNWFFKNNGDDTFTDIAASSGTEFNGLCWAGNFTDIDNDQDEDLYVSTSFNHVTNPNKFYINNGDETFTSTSVAGDTTRTLCNTFGDYNNDGLMDFVNSAIADGPVLFLENQSNSSNNFVKIDLEGTSSNKDGIGSWIEVYAGGLGQYKFTTSGTGYFSQESQRVHIGLGTNEIIDSLIIRWPSGQIDTYRDLSANITLNAVEGCLTCSDCDFHDPVVFQAGPIDPNTYYQEDVIVNGYINSDTSVSIRATNSIELQTEFKAFLGSEFLADIKQCFNPKR